MDSELEDSDSEVMDSDSEVMDSDSEVDLAIFDDSDSEIMVIDPAHAARAALLVARFAAAIQATKELQALQNRPQLLEKLVLKCLDKGDAATFLKQKRLFRMMPPPLLEKINLGCGSKCKWRHLPLAGVMANPHTRHLCLNLDEYSCCGEGDGWTLQELEQFCSDVARECKTSLLSLEIMSEQEPTGINPGLPLAMLSSLLLELRALTSLHIMGLCYLHTREIDLLVSTLASTNPDIRSLRLPYLSNKSLCTIADRWPQLEFLQPDRRQFDSSQLAAVLSRLRNLETLEMSSSSYLSDSSRTLSEAMLKVARAHDPASPPYKVSVGFSCYTEEPVSSGDMVKVFTGFPALHMLALKETDIPAVCAGLEGREHVHITDLVVESKSPNPRALEPLLALVGQHVTKLVVSPYHWYRESRVDLNMIGHYCPKLEDLTTSTGRLVSGDEFQVTATFFSKLKRCTLRQDITRNSPAQLPTELVCSVMGSPNLEMLYFTGVPITEEVVAALAAERGRGALSSLEELTLRYSTPVSVEALAALASHAPRLREIRLYSSNWEDDQDVEMHGVLTLFMQQGGLKARVSSMRF